MAGPTEFSLEAVRQYMLARDGQVKHIQFLLILEIRSRQTQLAKLIPVLFS